MAQLGSPYTPGVSRVAAARAGLLGDSQTQLGVYGDTANWPGTATGFPVVGQVGPITRAEDKRIQYVAKFASRMFCLWEPADKQAFDATMQHITLGLFRLIRRDDRWDEEQRHFRTWLEWCIIYGVLGPPPVDGPPQ